MNRARQLGADGIILHKVDVLVEHGAIHHSVTSTLNELQEGQSELTIGPSFMEESASDNIHWIYYQSAIAIKYLPISSTEKTFHKSPVSTEHIPPLGKK